METKNLAILVIGLGMVAGSASAGTATSGGGGAYVCEGDRPHSKLVDLWEASTLPYKWPISGISVLPIVRESLTPWPAQLEKALGHLDMIDSGFAAQARAELSYLLVHQNPLPVGVGVSLPADLDVSYFPTGCPAQGIMRYNGITEKLDIKGELFATLETQTDIAAAWGHEAIYKAMRDYAGHETSLLSRRLNGCIFSGANCLGSGDLTEIEIKRYAAAYRCEHPLADYYLVSNNADAARSNWRVLYTRIGKSRFLTKTFQDFTLENDFGFSEGYVTGLLSAFGYNPARHLAIVVQLKSGPTGKELDWATPGDQSADLTLEGRVDIPSGNYASCRKL